MRKKVTVIGAGNVGATAAMRLAEKELADVVLIDVLEGVPAGKALDLTEAAPVEKHDSKIIGATGDYSEAKDSDIIIITAGIPRKPGMSRDDLLSTNMGIMGSVTKEVAAVAPNATLIIVSNPLDAMCHVAYEARRVPEEQGNWNGGCTGFGPFPCLYCDGVGCFCGKHPCLCIGGAWRYNGSPSPGTLQWPVFP